MSARPDLSARGTGEQQEQCNSAGDQGDQLSQATLQLSLGAPGRVQLAHRVDFKSKSALWTRPMLQPAQVVAALPAIANLGKGRPAWRWLNHRRFDRFVHAVSHQ